VCSTPNIGPRIMNVDLMLKAIKIYILWLENRLDDNNILHDDLTFDEAFIHAEETQNKDFRS